MNRPLIPLLFVGLAVACADDTPAGPDGSAPKFGVAGNSGCYTVEFDYQVSGLFPSFSGIAVGDIEANVDLEFDFDAAVFTGSIVHNTGINTWNVTGGIVPELVGTTFRTSTTGVVLGGVDNEPFVYWVNHTDRPIDGIAMANLTAHGTIDTHEWTPPFDTDLAYSGVICP